RRQFLLLRFHLASAFSCSSPRVRLGCMCPCAVPKVASCWSIEVHWSPRWSQVHPGSASSSASCEADRTSRRARQEFSHTPTGWLFHCSRCLIDEMGRPVTAQNCCITSTFASWAS